VRQKMRRLSGAVAVLSNRFQRHPEPAEVAAALDIDIDTYWRWRGEVNGAALVAMDEPGTPGQDRVSLAEKFGDPSVTAADDLLEREESVTGLREAIAGLPEKERTVLALYYYEELTLREIAEILHLTESRISQIRSQALRRLRTRLSPLARAS